MDRVSLLKISVLKFLKLWALEVHIVFQQCWWRLSYVSPSRWDTSIFTSAFSALKIEYLAFFKTSPVVMSGSLAATFNFPPLDTAISINFDVASFQHLYSSDDFHHIHNYLLHLDVYNEQENYEYGGDVMNNSPLILLKSFLLSINFYLPLNSPSLGLSAPGQLSLLIVTS